MSTEMNFDATNVKPASPNEPLPIGWYKMAIVASEMKRTNDQKGRYLKLELQVIDGDYKGRKAWTQLNLENENAQTVKIAQEQLSAICHATGVLKLTNSALLHNKPMLVKLSIKQSTGFDPKNEVKGYKPLTGDVPAIPAANAAAAAAAPTTAPAANTAAPAWAQKKAS
jgi:hypothetical protein